MSDKQFRREDRYIVIKRSDMEKLPVDTRRNFQGRCRNFYEQMLIAGAPARSFLVIESDWPEYEPVWQMIERRMSQPAAHLTIPGALEWDGDNGTHGADGESRAHGESAAAVATLKALGYTHNGGTHWKPPVGQKPDFDLIDQLRADLALERHTSKFWMDAHGEDLTKFGGQIHDLRTQLANTEQSRRSFFDLSKDLEKRLAERDAVQWIECNDRMPEPDVDVLVSYTPLGQGKAIVHGAFLSKAFDDMDHLFWFNGKGESMRGVVSHWMPMIALAAIEKPAKCESCGGWGHIETEDSAHDCPECGPSVIERAVEAGVMNAPKSYAADDIPDFTPGNGNKAKRRIAAIEAAKQKTCIECDQPYCHGVCVERGDQDYDRDQAAKGGDQ